MKKIFLLLLLASTSVMVYAQKSSSTTVSNNKNNTDSIGTTAFGLPVHRSYVAPDVVERAKKKYGRALYCIEKSITENCQESYLVGLIKKGKLNMEWMCDDPKLVLNQRNASLVPYQWMSN